MERYGYLGGIPIVRITIMKIAFWVTLFWSSRGVKLKIFNFNLFEPQFPSSFIPIWNHDHLSYTKEIYGAIPPSSNPAFAFAIGNLEKDFHTNRGSTEEIMDPENIFHRSVKKVVLH